MYTLRDGQPQQAWRAVQEDGFWVFQRQTRADQQSPGSPAIWRADAASQNSG